MMNRKFSIGALFALVLLIPLSGFAAQTWNFTSSVEGWTGRNGTNVRYSSDGGGRLYVDTYGNDPGIVSPALSLAASSNDLLRMYVWTYCADQNCTVYFMRSGSSTVFTGGTIALSSGSSGGTYELSMLGNADWTGTITQIRIDPSGYCGSPSSPGFVAFDWIQTTDTIPAAIQLTYPNGGETWTIGNTVTFQWSNPGGYTSFNVELSRNGGSTWETLYAGLPYNYYYRDWTVPGSASTNCRARVTGYYPGGSSSDISNAAFTICQPDLDVTYPNGGQSWWMGHDYTVTWSTTSCTDSYVKIELYRGANTMVRQFEAGTPNDGSQVINLPVDGTIAAASDYRIAVSAPDASPYDFSDAYFTISRPTITVTAPAGGSVYSVGSTVPIAWTSQQVLGNVHIEIYKDGTSFQVLNTSAPNNGSYSWVVPGDAPTSACYTVGISAMYGHVYDFSDCFTVNGCTPTVSVTYPNGGQTLYLGHDCTVTWNSSECMTENVKIELYKAEDMVLQFEAGTPNDGSEVVSFPVDETLVAGGDYRMAISAVDMSPWDFSDSYFTLMKPSLTITAPTSGNQFDPGTACQITWTSDMVLGNIQVDLYNGDVFLTQLAAGTSNTGSLTWNIPSDQSPGARYQIALSAMSEHVYDFSEYFTIGNPPQAVYPAAAFFSQLDPAWSAQKLGTCSDTIGQSGCAITCVAMLLAWESRSSADPNPALLNTWLTQHGGYSDGCYLNWEIAEDYDSENSGLEFAGSVPGVPDQWSYIDNELNASPFRPVMVEVDGSPSTSGWLQHFVVVYARSGESGIPGSYLILDPLQLSFVPQSPRTLAHYTRASDGVTFDGVRKWSGTFPLTAPTIDVTSPLGGEVWICGEVRVVTWNSSDITGDIQIQPYRGTTPLENIAAGAPNTGSFSWTIPNDYASADDYRIGLSAMNGQVSDFSGFFSIHAPTGVSNNELPDRVTLFAPEPNPFNPRTTISFSLPAPGSAKLTIFDVRGAHVATLVDADLPEGRQSAEWNGLDERGAAMPSGVYLARLETAAEVQTVKVTLAR